MVTEAPVAFVVVPATRVQAVGDKLGVLSM